MIVRRSTLNIGLVVLLALWPFYIEFEVIQNAGVNPQRLMALVIVALFVFSVTTDSRHFVALREAWRMNPVFHGLMVAYFVWRIAAAVLAGEAKGLLLVAFEVFTYLAVYFVFLIYTFRLGYADRWLMILEKVFLVICGLCLIEFLLGQNLFSRFATNLDRAAIVTETVVRQEGHRVKATFEHPLTLVHFIAIVFPFVLINRLRSSSNFVSYGLLILCAAVMLLTRSRSAVVLMLALGFVYFVVVSRRYSFDQRLLLWIFFGSVFVVFLFALIAFASEFYGKSLFSSDARYAQLVNSYYAISAEPFFGYGPGYPLGVLLYDLSREFANSGALKLWEANAGSIDNRFLSIALESGIPSLLLFVGFNVVVLLKAFRLLGVLSAMGERDKLLESSILSIIGALLVMAILSIFTVHSFYYMALASLVYSTDRAGQRVARGA